MQTAPHPPNRVWSVILAGGEGERVRPLIQRWLGRHRPKQYCTFVGQRSMFQHTVDRASALTHASRLVTVIARDHRREAFSQLDGREVGMVLLQPENRDTAAGVFLPLTYIRAYDRNATVVLYPSDHFVFPEERFQTTVLRATQAAERLQDRLILLGVQPDCPELEYGWIQPERFLTRAGTHAVCSIRAFLEKPSAAQAEEAMARGSLWNTLVLAAKLSTLWELGWQCFPAIMNHFERLGDAIGTSEEGRVLRTIYNEMPRMNLSSDLLQRVPERVAVIELFDVLWSDWGKPERIAETIQRIGRKPAFPLECLKISARSVPLAG
jgi:mannose-1-phosphate guanylyltransferase